MGFPHDSSTSTRAFLPAEPLLELDEEAASLGYLPLLSTLLRVVALVVPAQQQDDLVAVKVDEDPQEHLLLAAACLRRSPPNIRAISSASC